MFHVYMTGDTRGHQGTQDTSDNLVIPTPHRETWSQLRDTRGHQGTPGDSVVCNVTPNDSVYSLHRRHSDQDHVRWPGPGSQDKGNMGQEERNDGGYEQITTKTCKICLVSCKKF